MDGRQLVHGCESRQFECVVAIGSAFDLRPSPRFAVRVGDEVGLLQFVAKISQPAGSRTGFEYQHVCVVLPDELREFTSQRVNGGEFV